MLTKKIRKSIIKESVGMLLIEKGYKIKDFGLGDFGYKLDKGNYNFNEIYFNFKNNGDIYVSSLQISFSEIENIILEIGLPTIILDKYISRKYFLTTIKDSFFTKCFNEKYRYYSFKTEAEVQEFSDWLIHYLSTKGFAFVEHYSFLPNVLAKMNQLMEDGKYWAEILSGQVDNVFRGLIISKLCGDKEFVNKLKYWNEKIYANENIKEWIPYFEKLKEKLKTIEPKYNAADGSVLNFENIT